MVVPSLLPEAPGHRSESSVASGVSRKEADASVRVEVKWSCANNTVIPALRKQLASGIRPALPVPVVLLLEDPWMHWTKYMHMSHTLRLADAQCGPRTFADLKCRFDKQVVGRVTVIDSKDVVIMPLAECVAGTGGDCCSEDEERVVDEVRTFFAALPEHSVPLCTLNGSLSEKSQAYLRTKEQNLSRFLGSYSREFVLVPGQEGCEQHVVHALPPRRSCQDTKREPAGKMCGEHLSADRCWLAEMEPALLGVALMYTSMAQLARVSWCSRTLRDATLAEGRIVINCAARMVLNLGRLLSLAARALGCSGIIGGDDFIEFQAVALCRPLHVPHKKDKTIAHFRISSDANPIEATLKAQKALRLVELDYIVDLKCERPFARAKTKSNLPNGLPNIVCLRPDWRTATSTDG